MSRDLLTTTANETTTESQSQTRSIPAPVAPENASHLVTNLLDRFERGWSGSRPESQNLWQLAGE
jgi:hypothetical protein